MKTHEETLFESRGTKNIYPSHFTVLILINDLSEFVDLLNQVLFEINKEKHLEYWANELMWHCYFEKNVQVSTYLLNLFEEQYIKFIEEGRYVGKLLDWIMYIKEKNNKLKMI